MFLSPQELRDAFPDWERYDAMRRKVDPNDTFENDFLRRNFNTR
jgi:hypothetical protein